MRLIQAEIIRRGCGETSFELCGNTCSFKLLKVLFWILFRETDEKTAQGQRDSGRRIGERITDTTFWRNEVRNELERLITETNLLQDGRRAIDKAIADIEGPLHIAQECLYQRENRQGIKV